MTKHWFLPLAALVTSAVIADQKVGVADPTTSFINNTLSNEELNIVQCDATNTAYIPAAIRDCLSDIDCAQFAGCPLETLISNTHRAVSVVPVHTAKAAIKEAIEYYQGKPELEPATYLDALSKYQQELNSGQATFAYKPTRHDDVTDGRIQEKKVCPPPALKNDVVTGSALFIKGKGVVCGDVKVGKNVSVGGDVTFNNRGCTKLRAKGALEKNLLNLRGVFAFDCAPCLSLMLINECGTTTGPTPKVGCFDLKAQLGNPVVRQRCGFGIAPECATVKATASAAAGYVLTQTGAPLVLGPSIDSLITDVAIEVLIPLSFCVPFCDCPALLTSYEDRSVCPRTICVDEVPGVDADVPLVTDGEGATILGVNVAGSERTVVFKGTEVSLQHASRANVWLKLTLKYTHYAINVIDNNPAQATTNRSALCTLQQEAIQKIGNDANNRLQSLWVHVIAEGRVL